MMAQTRVPDSLEARDAFGAFRGAKWILFARLVVALTILTYLLLSEGGWGATWPTRIVYATIVGVLALNALYLVLLARIENVAMFAAVQIGVDIAIVSFLVYLTGGITSQMIVLHLLLILASALALSWRAAVAFSGEAAALHFVVAIAGVLGLGPGRPVGGRETLSSLFVQLLGFFAVAFLSGLLARRLSLARLLSSEILEAIGQGILVAGPDERLLYANAEAVRLLGATKTDTGSPLSGVFAEEVWKRMHIDPVTGVGMLREIEIPDANGKPVPVSVVVRPALAEGIKPMGTLAVLTDRTLERRYEGAMMQAQRSEAVSEMAAAIAHEIRNPLAAMRGSVQEISRRLEALGEHAPRDADGLIEIVLSESDRLDAIISDFLAFARMRPVRKSECQMCKVIREAAVMLERDAAEQGAEGIEVAWECDEKLTGRIDAMQVRQVLLNLGLNSINALDGVDGAKVSITAKERAFLDSSLGGEEAGAARAVPGAGERIGVEVCVQDNGAGMSPETKRKAMSPFFTTRERGTGLGLAVVDRVVKAHSGFVRIESEDGAGTTVRIWLPTEGE